MDEPTIIAYNSIGSAIPLEPYEVLHKVGRFVVKRNTALVAEVIALKQQRIRNALNAGN